MHSLSIGAIIISVIMAFFIKFPLVPLFLLLSIFISYTSLFKTNMVTYLIVICFSIILGTLCQQRVKLKDSSNFLPINQNVITYGNIYIVKDSIPVNGGFLSSGIIFQIKSHQMESQSKLPILVFSKKQLYLGEVLIDSKIKWSDKGATCNVDIDGQTIVKSKYYELRKKIILELKWAIKSPLLLALLTGNKSKLELSQIAMFRESGCSHILALSGFHVSIITILFIFLLRLLFTGSKIYIFCIIILTVYLCIVGITPSLLRSVLMFSIATILRYKGYHVSVYKILVISFFIIIILVPEEFYTLSFRLSYLALFGILTFANEVSLLPLLNRLPTILKLSISASFSAMLSTSLICLPLFGLLYPIGIVASIILTPIITIFIWIGILSLFIPKLNFLVLFIEDFIYVLLKLFSNSPVIDNNSVISPFITFIILSIPVILLILKLYRRTDARRFNIKFKL